MKRFILTFVLIVLAFAVCVMPAQAALRAFEITVYKATSPEQLHNINLATRLTADVSYTVLAYTSNTVKTVTRETIYSDTVGTTLAQDPWVAETVFEATDNIKFWCDPTASDDATVRILVVDKANGYSGFYNVAYNKTHSIVIDEIPGILHCLTVPFWSDKSAAQYTAVDTAVDLRPGVVIIDAYIDVHAVTTTAGSLDVGTNDSNAAFVAGSATNALGMVHDDVFDTAFQYITFAAGVDDRGIYYKPHDPDPFESGDGFINILFIEN